MMPSRLVTGIAALAAVGVGTVAGALVAVPSLSGARNFPNTVVVAAPSGSTSTTTPNGTAPGKRFFGDRANDLLDAAASALHLTPEQLRQKLSDGKTTIADVAAQQHVDVNTVIDAMVNADRERITNIVNNPLPQKLFMPGIGPSDKVPFGPSIRFGIVGEGLDTAAQALGITPAELKSDLAKGMSIADIAKSKNIDVNKVIDALVADANAKIDAAVSSGKLPQDRADQLKAAIRSAITAFVNNSMPKLPMGPGGGFGFKFGGDHGFGPYGRPGSVPGSTAPTTTTTVKPATS
jgi:hypothetical protein